MDITFNSAQLLALKKLENFLKNPDEKIIILEGYAGTGKSTVISSLFKNSAYSKLKVCMSATTNKAVQVLKKMGDLGNKKVDYLTIHKLLRIKRTIDSDGKQHFITSFDETSDSRNKKCKSIYSYNVVVIDESSMINNSMFKDLEIISTKIPGKIIFVGDRNQLPPVNQTLSNVFTTDKYQNIQLIKIMRATGNNKIIDLSNYIRTSIAEQNNLKLKQFKDDHVFIHRKQLNWLNCYIEKIVELSKNEKSVILAYTNNRCNVINFAVRSILFTPEQLSQKYVPGEHIIFNNFYQTKNNKYYTSQNEIIKEVSIEKFKIEKLDLSEIINLKNKLNPLSKKTENDDLLVDPCQICNDDEVDDCCVTVCEHKLCIECIKQWINKNKCCPLCLTEVSDEKFIVKDCDRINYFIDELNDLILSLEFDVYRIKLINGDYINTLTDNSKKRYGEVEKRIKAIMTNIKNEIVSNKKIINFGLVILSRLWLFIFNNIVDVFAEINYGYCITSHKSQGSTYTNVFVDISNILNFNRDPTDGMKCLYTSVTRASDTLHLFY